MRHVRLLWNPSVQVIGGGSFDERVLVNGFGVDMGTDRIRLRPHVSVAHVDPLHDGGAHETYWVALLGVAVEIGVARR